MRIIDPFPVTRPFEVRKNTEIDSNQRYSIRNNELECLTVVTVYLETDLKSHYGVQGPLASRCTIKNIFQGQKAQDLMEEI